MSNEDDLRESVSLLYVRDFVFLKVQLNSLLPLCSPAKEGYHQREPDMDRKEEWKERKEG